MFYHGWNDAIPTSTWLKYHHSEKKWNKCRKRMRSYAENDASLFLDVLYHCLG